MKSPFEDLQINPRLVCEFFAAFARFEFAMKETRFCRGDQHGNAIPNWNLLKSELGSLITPFADGEKRDLVDYLLTEPPEIQKVRNGRPQFEPVPLSGANPGAQAIEAAKRVRNNLFHGGKHTPHSSAERDTKLINGAFVVLDACLAADPDLNSTFEQQIF